MDETFRGAPWEKLEADELQIAEAYTFLEERQLGAWLTETKYFGRGEIVDAGAFLGASALSFCVGLERNKRIPERAKVGRIHSFDTFEWRPWINKKFLPADVTFGNSFLGRYHDNVRKYEHFLTIHPGDISRRNWRFGEIEILFIDCAKSFAANAAVLRLFFPQLFPGSFVVQQDYCVPSKLVWLHATMEFLWNKFEDQGIARRGGSTVFSVVEPITADEIETCIDAMKTDCVGLAERALNRYASTDRRRAAIAGSLASHRDAPLPLG